MYHSGTYLEGELEEKGENKGKCPSHYICKSVTFAYLLLLLTLLAFIAMTSMADIDMASDNNSFLQQG